MPDPSNSYISLYSLILYLMQLGIIQAQFVGPAGLFGLDHGFSRTIPCTILKLRYLKELDMPGRKKQPCGARTRRGTACRCKVLANGRCRLYGGLSTGPKTLRGKLKAFQNLRQYRALPSQGVYEVLDLIER